MARCDKIQINVSEDPQAVGPGGGGAAVGSVCGRCGAKKGCGGLNRKRKAVQTSEKGTGTARRSYIPAFVITVVCMALTVGMGAAVVRFYNGYGKSADTADDMVYDRYYVMITDDHKSSFWTSVYQGAYMRGLENNVYVDWLGGNLPQEYDKEDLMRIAIASGVDGIIVTADEGEEIAALIDEASAQGIPVVTLYGDNTHSSRCSFVGVGSYNLGREYGRMGLYLLADIIGNKDNAERRLNSGRKDGEVQFLDPARAIGGKVKIAVLVNAYASDVDQNILYSGIQETMENEKSTGIELEFVPISIDDTNDFSVEESIRDIFMEENVPDIIVCLDELSTTCVYQAVVDYNMVGDVNILGYFVSDTIANAIDRNVIYATAVIDTRQMGGYCIEALQEYHDLGYTSQYFTADVTVINKNNVAQYLDYNEEENADE